jgi:hypothetical protein
MSLLHACAAVGLGLAIVIKYAVCTFIERSDMFGVFCFHNSSAILGSSQLSIVLEAPVRGIMSCIITSVIVSSLLE